MIARGRDKGRACLTAAAACALGACSVKLQAPDEPIRFDVNINITEQKRLEIDQELLALIRQNPALFGFEAGDLADSSSRSEAQ
jgi:hypothetical protein